MANYMISVRNRPDVSGLEEPLTALAAYRKVLELRDAGHEHIAITDLKTGERIADVERRLLRKRERL